MEKEDWEFVKHRLRSILHYTREDEWVFSEDDTDFVATKVASENEGKNKDGDEDKRTRLAVRVKASWKEEQKKEGITTEQVYEHQLYSQEDDEWSTESSYTKNLYKEDLKGKAVANFRYCMRDTERDLEYQNIWLTQLDDGKSETELADLFPEWARG